MYSFLTHQHALSVATTILDQCRLQRWGELSLAPFPKMEMTSDNTDSRQILRLWVVKKHVKSTSRLCVGVNDHHQARYQAWTDPHIVSTCTIYHTGIRKTCTLYLHLPKKLCADGLDDLNFMSLWIYTLHMYGLRTQIGLIRSMCYRKVNCVNGSELRRYRLWGIDREPGVCAILELLTRIQPWFPR
jgi:hypothetical protein